MTKRTYLKCSAVRPVIPCTGQRAKHCAINIKKLIVLRKEFGSSSLFTGHTSLMRLFVYNFMTFVFAVETADRYFGSAADIRWHISVALPVKICVRLIFSKSVQQNALLKSTADCSYLGGRFFIYLLIHMIMLSQGFLLPSGVFHCTHNNSVCHTSLLTACEQDQDGTSSVLILLANCKQTCMTYTIAVCTVKNS